MAGDQRRKRPLITQCDEAREQYRVRRRGRISGRQATGAVENVTEVSGRHRASVYQISTREAGPRHKIATYASTGSQLRRAVGAGRRLGLARGEHALRRKKCGSSVAAKNRRAVGATRHPIRGRWRHGPVPAWVPSFYRGRGRLGQPEGLAEVHRQLEGLGYVPLFEGSKNLRDAEHGVRIEFIVTGQFPGDGKPKPVAFPNPADSHVDRDGIRLLPLKALIELKLASGMTDPGRLKDLADVQELIRTLGLPEEYGAGLNEFVREQFRTLLKGVHPE